MNNIVAKVRAAGVVGAGGAGFPTHVKLNSKVDTVIANGAECEPLLKADRYLMTRHAPQVVAGLRLVMQATGAPRGIIAQPVETKVDITELMGNEIFLFLKSGKHDFVARVDPRTKASGGDEIQLVFNMENMHIFDRETELAIR